MFTRSKTCADRHAGEAEKFCDRANLGPQSTRNVVEFANAEPQQVADTHAANLETATPPDDRIDHTRTVGIEADFDQDLTGDEQLDARNRELQEIAAAEAATRNFNNYPNQTTNKNQYEHNHNQT